MHCRCALHKNQWYPIREVKRVDLPTSPSELHSSLNEVNKFSETTITVGAKAYYRFIELWLAPGDQVRSDLFVHQIFESVSVDTYCRPVWHKIWYINVLRKSEIFPVCGSDAQYTTLMFLLICWLHQEMTNCERTFWKSWQNCRFQVRTHEVDSHRYVHFAYSWTNANISVESRLRPPH